MHKTNHFLSLALLAFFNAAFASDPVSWTLTPAGGFSPTQVGHQSHVTYTLTNHLPLAATIVTSITSTGGNFSVVNGCAGKNLAPNGRCHITIGFSPSEADVSTLQLTYGYHNNRIPLPTLRAQGTAAPAGAVQGSIAGLPAVMTLNPLQTPDFTLTYTNAGNAAVTGFAGNAMGADIVSVTPGVANVAVLENNCGTPGVPVVLQPQASCTVTGQITPTHAGQLALRGLFTYGTKSAQVLASALVEQGSGSCTVHGQTALPLPAVTYQYSDNTVKFIFENECSATAATLGQVQVATSFTPNSGQSATTTVLPLYDTCSGQTLPAQGQCYVIASVIPNDTAQDMKIEAQVLAGGVTASASTSAPVRANNSSSHTVHFVNQCPFNVWYGIANGSGGLFSPDPTPGSQNSGGAPASAYLLPKQVTGQLPSTIDLTVSAYINGAIWPRTGCASDGVNFACETGMCNTLSATSGTCVVRGGALDQPSPPYTKFEFTINSTPATDGVYDVSVINGMNVPVEIKGLGSVAAGAPFQCTGAGALIQPPGNSLGSCPWAFDPSFSGLLAVDVVWVSAGADDACLSDSDCSNGQVCGMAFNSVPANAPINRRCGDFIGYTAITNFVGYPLNGQWGSQNLYTKYDIGTPMTTISAKNYGTFGGNPAIFGNLLACQVTSNDSANTCYNSGLPNLANCCGCVDWPTSSVPTAVNASCAGTNADWTNTAGTEVTGQNAILWLKKACPTAYSYQFDDPSSSFTCNPGATTRTSYQIVFCPGGQSSLPAGAVDGR